MTTIILIIYLIGVVVAYVFLKAYHHTFYDTWTVKNRMEALLTAFFSSWVVPPVLVLVYFLMKFINFLDELLDDKPAKW